MRRARSLFAGLAALALLSADAIAVPVEGMLPAAAGLTFPGAPGGASPGGGLQLPGGIWFNTPWTADDAGFRQEGAANRNAHEYTAAAWLRPTSNSGDKMVFGQTGGDPLHNGTRDNSYHFGHWGADSGGGAVNGIPLGDWRHVTWRFRDTGAGFAQEIFVNGTLVSGPSIQNGLTNNQNVIIGTANNEAGRSFVGGLDDVLIYNVALTDLEISSLAGGSIVGSPQVYLPFEEGGGNTAFNSGALGGQATATVANFEPAQATEAIFNPEDGHYYAINPNTQTWVDAESSAGVFFINTPDGPVAAHLATLQGNSDGRFLQDISGGSNWIGFTDNEAYGGTEFGNTSVDAGFPSTGLGVDPNTVPGIQRGEGWVNVDGSPATYNLWNGGGEPNDAGGEDAAEFLDNGLLNDLPINGTLLPSLLEFDVPAQGGRLTVKQVPVAGMDAGSITNSLPLIEAALVSETGVTKQYYGVNFADPEGGGAALLPGRVPFPGDVRNVNDDNFAIEVTGFLNIPVAGQWTLAVERDDVYQITIDGQEVEGSCCGQTLHVLTLNEGVVEFRALFGEIGGDARFELATAMGAHSTFDATQFAKIGDVLGGGLQVVELTAGVPEPATGLLALLGLGGLGLRRRRRAA